jgi:hypothetical protein
MRRIGDGLICASLLDSQRKEITQIWGVLFPGSPRSTWAEKRWGNPTIAFPELATNSIDRNLHPSLVNRNNCEPG